MRGVIGAIDCTHVKIVRPKENESFYVNRKGFHSINVQAVCDSKGTFMNVVAKKPGSCHDSAIFYDSSLGKSMLQGKFGEGYLLGDSGYGCTPFLITPYLNPQTPEQLHFNNVHATARNVVERAFGVIKRRFHCLQTQFRFSPSRTCKIIVACIVLHNIARQRRCEEFEDDAGEEEEEQHFVPEVNILENDRNVLRARGYSKRDRIASELFA